jgi:Uma2 family endonuclease
MATQPKPLLTPEQYLEIERKAEFKSEYYKGEMFLMAGASFRHSKIIHNLHVSLNSVEACGCDVTSNDLRVRISETGLYTYPDMVIVCGKPEFADREMDTLLNPSVIIEVLSDSTESYDRGKKAWHYHRLPSLKDYLLVSQDEVSVEHQACQGDGSWLLREIRGLDAVIDIPAIGCALPLAGVYREIEFA